MTDAHACTLSRTYPGGIGQCSCGRWWMPAPWSLREMVILRPELRARLREYRWQIETGRHASLRDAVRAAAWADGVARRERQQRLNERWERKQRSKEATARRVLRPMVLDGRPCAYCGGIAVCVDHIIPQARGGRTVLRNLAPACNRCNEDKSGRTPEQWKAWRLARGKPWPPPIIEAKPRKLRQAVALS